MTSLMPPDVLKKMCRETILAHLDNEAPNALRRSLPDGWREIFIQKSTKMLTDFLFRACSKKQLNPVEMKNRPYSPEELQALQAVAAIWALTWDQAMRLMRGQTPLTQNTKNELSVIIYNDFVRLGLKPDEISEILLDLGGQAMIDRIGDRGLPS